LRIYLIVSVPVCGHCYIAVRAEIIEQNGTEEGQSESVEE